MEHVAGNPERPSRLFDFSKSASELRKYDIDSFAHYRMKIRNPDTILKALR